MAEGKKSFILYADLIHTVRKMDKDEIAELFLTILSYVNDENPVIESRIVDLVFEPIKNQLKRDLKNWEHFREKQAINGAKGGRPKNPNNPSLFSETQKSLNVTVNDTVTVNANDTVTVKKKATTEKIILPWDSEQFKNQWERWRAYKKNQHKFTYKSADTEQAALIELSKLSGGHENAASEIITQSIANGWKGFFSLKTNHTNGNEKKPTGAAVSTTSILSRIAAMPD